MDWTFDAPQFVDFTQPQAHDDEYDDTWFDTHREDDLPYKEKGAEPKAIKAKPQKKLCSTGHRLENAVKEAGEAAGRSPRHMNSKPARVPVAEKHAADCNIRNMCPSPQKQRKIAAASLSPSATSRQQLSLQVPESTSTNDCPSANTRLRKSGNVDQSQSPRNFRRAKSASPGNTPHRNKPTRPMRGAPSRVLVTIDDSSNSKEATASRVPGLGAAVKRSQSLRNRVISKASSTASLRSDESVDSAGKDRQESDSTAKHMTTEDLEMAKIAAMKKDVEKARKLAQESYKKAISAQGYIPLRSSQPPTLTVSFHFKTDERIKNPEGHGKEEKVKDFTKQLREALPMPALPSKPGHTLTHLKPFKFTATKSTAPQSQAEKYESVAERITAFHRKTPDRFRSQPHGGRDRARSALKSQISSTTGRMRSQSPKMTIPKTPNLTTRGRSRPVHAMSREEQEQMEFEEHQKQQFKAHPVNPRVFEAPKVPAVAPKAATVVEEFHLHSQHSASISSLGSSEAEERHEFHARPVNPRILAGPVGVKSVEPKPVTIPESPAFALKNRVRIPLELPKEDTKELVKANPVPHMGLPFKPQLLHQYTVPQPFAVEERSREMLTRREHKIQQILEEEKKAREFHAQDLPSESPGKLPPKQTRPITLPEPFHLEVDERGEKYQKEFMSKVEEEERLAHEIANFKAGPNNVIHKEPFHAVKSTKPLTERVNLHLNTDVRASQREAFDQYLKAREAEMEALKRQREERLEKEEKAAVARMRMQAVHRANSIRKYKSVIVKPSDKPLTEAQSPRFSQRLKEKHNSSDL
ncbi:unnamed protein product [Candidula unifasciata]|uniref:Targeting protein for Xklp2 n=1 Tax=Candidula unifasciata TaxID=100452 RepID=A0A8S4A552_9EUPU|nr:unnamed protein product [Candidula unifasciata]